MSDQTGDSVRLERLAEVRSRTSWDPANDPDPVIRRMFEESQGELAEELARRTGA